MLPITRHPGRARLEQQLVALYEKVHPAKRDHAFTVSEDWYGYEDRLNQGLAQTYGTSLAPFPPVRAQNSPTIVPLL
jgi:hypothetical protein